MQHTHDRRVSGVRRVPVERLVDVCGSADPASAFQGRSVDVSCRGMQVRASYLPQLHSPIVLRFHEHGAEVIAEGEVAWRRTITNGGEFGVRFTALDSRSVQTLKALCGVAGLEETDAYTQPGGAVAPISSRAPTSSGVSSGSVTTSSGSGAGGVLSGDVLSGDVLSGVSGGTPSRSVASSRSRTTSSSATSSSATSSSATSSSATSSSATSSGAGRDLDHDTDPAPPATLGVRLHVAGLSAPLQARVKAQVSNRLELGSQLDFLRVGRALEVEDLAYGGKRTAYVESLDVSVDPKSRVPELVVSVRYADASDAAQPGSSRIGTPEPQRARSLARGRSYWETEVPSTTPPPTTPRPAPERGRTPAPPELELSDAADSGDGTSDGALDSEDERDTTPPPLPLRVDRAERPAAAASKSAETSSKEPSSKQPTVELAARARSEEEEQESADVDSTEALLARLDGLLRGVPQAARAASEQVARWGGAASRGAGQLFAQARRAMSASRRPAAPRRRTAAAPRSSLRSSPLRQSAQPSSQQRPRIDEAADALRRRGTRTVLWSCLVAVLAIGIGYAARPSRQVATPAAARVSSATAAALPAPAASVPLARASTPGGAASEPLPSLGAAPLRVPSASVAEDEVGVPPSNDGPSSKSQLQDESPPSPARGQIVTAGSDEFGQGRMHLPVIYRLRLDEPGGSLRGERTATGFDITIVGRRVLDSANAIAKRDSRIAKVSTHNSSQGTRVSFRFRDEIPAYKVRLRRDAVEFLISSS